MEIDGGRICRGTFPHRCTCKRQEARGKRGWQTFKTKLGLNVKKEPWVAEAVAK